MVSDQTIYNAIRTGRLKPRDVGLRQFEVRFNAPRDVEPDDPENYCDLVSVVFDDAGRVGSFVHCSDSHTDIPGDDIEGIGGEYAHYFDGGGYYPTTSYLSDDKVLHKAVQDIVTAPLVHNSHSSPAAAGCCTACTADGTVEP